MTTEAEQTTQDSPKKPARRRWWRYALFTVLILLILLAGTFSWLLGTHAGLRFALFRLPEMAGTQITAQSLQGTFWRGFNANRVVIATPDMNIDLEHLILDWQSSKLFKRHLHIQRLELGPMHLLKTGKSEEKKSKPISFPKSIRLPITVNIDQLISRGITWGEKRDVILSDASLSFAYDHQQHALKVSHIGTSWGEAAGQLTVKTQTPFPVDGHIDLSGLIEQELVTGNTHFSGSLKNLNIHNELSNRAMLMLADVHTSPFAASLPEKLHQVTVKTHHFQPQIFWTSAPSADLYLYLSIEPQNQQDLGGVLLMTNEKPLPAGKGIPVRNSFGTWRVDADNLIHIESLQSEMLQNGLLNVEGSIGEKLNIDANIEHLTLADIMGGKPIEPLFGKIHVDGKTTEPDISWDLKRLQLLAQGKITIRPDSKNNGQTITIHQADFKDSTQNGWMKLSGSLNTAGKRPIDLVLEHQNFNPALLGKDFPTGSLNGKTTLSGNLNPMIFDVQTDLNQSQLSGHPFTLKSHIDYRDSHIAPSFVRLDLGNNQIHAEGTFGLSKDQLNLNINAPQLAQLGFGLTGALSAKGFIAGEPKKIRMNLDGQAQSLGFREQLNLQDLRFHVVTSPDLKAPLDVAIDGKNLRVGTQEVAQINLNANGSLSSHHAHAQAAMNLSQKPYQLNITANGGLNNDYQWKGTISQLNISDTLNVVLENPVSLLAGAKQVNVGDARWQILGGNLHLNHLQWKAGDGIHTRGVANHIQLSELEKLFSLPVQQDLVLNADWNLQYNHNPQGTLNIVRQSGDVTLKGKKRPIGIEDFRLNTVLSSGHIRNNLIAKTRFANADGALDIAQRYGDSLMHAPLSGSLNIRADDLSQFKSFIPINMRLRGSLLSDVKIHGTLASPQLSGSLNGEQLSYLEMDTGIFLTGGTLQSRFDGQEWKLDSLKFTHRDGGFLESKGIVSLLGKLPSVDLGVHVEHYPILRRPDRRVTISGDADVRYANQSGLGLNGNLKLDKAEMDFPKSNMPKLDEDVVIKDLPQIEKGTPLLLSMNVDVDLNDAFHFSGKGLDILMGGQLNLTAKPQEDFKLLGKVKVLSGRYKAFGQDLAVEKGQVTFTGPLANPSLSIKAKRNMSPVGAGLEVSGNVEHPHVRLFADSPMSDKDKLSWLILGHAATSADGPSLAAAAAAMAAGTINDKIGLVDDIGLAGKEEGVQGGQVNPAEQMVVVGKHLSEKIYLGYEYGLTSTTQTVKMIYQLGKAIQLIGRVGSYDSGGEVRYSKRFD